MLRKASPERVRSRVREEEAEEEVGRNLSCDAAWLPPPASFLNETLPTYSYAEHELILKHESTASTKKETSLARRAAGHFGRIFLGKFNGGRRRTCSLFLNALRRRAFRPRFLLFGYQLNRKMSLPVRVQALEAVFFDQRGLVSPRELPKLMLEFSCLLFFSVFFSRSQNLECALLRAAFIFS